MALRLFLTFGSGRKILGKLQWLHNAQMSHNGVDEFQYGAYKYNEGKMTLDGSARHLEVVEGLAAERLIIAGPKQVLELPCLAVP